jgi:hypothetical protein
LRAAARRLGARLSFEHTERLLAMAGLASPENSWEAPRAGKFELPGGITAEQSLREIRLTRSASVAPPDPSPLYAFLIPGEIRAPEYGVHLRGERAAAPEADGLPCAATLRGWKAGDRVTLRHSRGPKKVAEVLDRLHVLGPARKNWPVVESAGKIVWMRGVEVDAPEFRFIAAVTTGPQE